MPDDLGLRPQPVSDLFRTQPPDLAERERGAFDRWEFGERFGKPRLGGERRVLVRSLRPEEPVEWA
ncbi:MAG TPA: hypothetical protein VNI55_01710 [Gaiellaceae bacterium]|nr:hypothetical protein [Gaiellaceae bacterium]